MKYCKHCKLSYHTPLKTCFFCNNELDTMNNLSEGYSYPPFKKEPHVRKTILKIIFFLLFVANAICLYLDFSPKPGTLSWSLYVLSASIYTFFFVQVLTRKASAIYKVFILVTITILEVLSIGLITGSYHWATDFVLPFSIILLNITMTSFIIGKRTRLYDNIIYVFTSCIFSIFPLLLLLFHVTVTTWPSIACIIYNIIILISLCYFRPNEIKNELFRRIHF